ncbi:MAG: hypothetical protein H7X92_06640 [Chitinophagales bacterium]|nr:hypothetical protein [Hyphomicrobiales bacterium]
MSYTCPCCGYNAFSGPVGSFEICNVCFWEDCPIESLDISYEGGPNKISLLKYQKQFLSLGKTAPVLIFLQNVLITRLLKTHRGGQSILKSTRKMLSMAVIIGCAD